MVIRKNLESNALISVYDKTDLKKICSTLIKYNIGLISTGATAKKIALLGEDYHGLKPTMLVKVGDNVIKGQPLFEDKKNPGVNFISSASGKVIEINRYNICILLYPLYLL